MQLTDERASQGLKGLVETWGPFQAHNIRLSANVYTMGAESRGGYGRHGRFLALAASLYGKDLSGVRVLDLGCFEGISAIEFARRGATVLGLEARKANLEKARGAAAILGLNNVSFALDDVRKLSRGKYGSFDIVICSGVLYHLDQPDLFQFVRNMVDCCDRIAVVDTATATKGAESVEFEGRKYWGKSVVEHNPDDDEATRLQRGWASLDNDRSFYLTRASLINLMTAAGLSSVSELKMPFKYRDGFHRTTFFGFKTGGDLSLADAAPFPEAPHGGRAGKPAVRVGPNAVQAPAGTG